MRPSSALIDSQPRHTPRPADPCAMVIFGATGDLTKRLVMPALYNLARSKVLPENFALIGVARRDETTASWREHLHQTLQSFVGNAAGGFDIDHIDEAAWRRLTANMSFVRGDLAEAGLYEQLREALDHAEKHHGTKGNVIFYLAIADQLFGTVVERLGKAKLTDQTGRRRRWRRVV